MSGLCMITARLTKARACPCLHVMQAATVQRKSQQRRPPVASKWEQESDRHKSSSPQPAQPVATTTTTTTTNSSSIVGSAIASYFAKWKGTGEDATPLPCLVCACRHAMQGTKTPGCSVILEGTPPPCPPLETVGWTGLNSFLGLSALAGIHYGISVDAGMTALIGSFGASAALVRSSVSRASREPLLICLFCTTGVRSARCAVFAAAERDRGAHAECGRRRGQL